MVFSINSLLFNEVGRTVSVGWPRIRVARDVSSDGGSDSSRSKGGRSDRGGYESGSVGSSGVGSMYVVSGGHGSSGDGVGRVCGCHRAYIRRDGDSGVQGPVRLASGDSHDGS